MIKTRETRIIWAVVCQSRSQVPQHHKQYQQQYQQPRLQRIYTFIGNISLWKPQTLTMIHMRNLTAAPSRMQSMLLRLQQYDVTIKYVPGKGLTIIDALSRLPSTNTQHIKLDLSVHFVQFSTDRLKAATYDDPTRCALRDTINQGWPEK